MEPRDHGSWWFGRGGRRQAVLSRSDWVTKGLVDRMSSAGFGQFGAALGSGRRPTRVAEPVKGGLPVCSGFCLDGWFVDPGFGGWWRGGGVASDEAFGVGGVGGVEHGLALRGDHDRGVVVDVGGMVVADA